MSSSFRIGAHTYFFSQYGYDQAARLDEIFDTVAEAGFQAIEMSTPMLGPAERRESFPRFPVSPLPRLWEGCRGRWYQIGYRGGYLKRYCWGETVNPC